MKFPGADVPDCYTSALLPIDKDNIWEVVVVPARYEEPVIRAKGYTVNPSVSILNGCLLFAGANIPQLDDAGVASGG
jgi:hypothetical protein